MADLALIGVCCFPTASVHLPKPRQVRVWHWPSAWGQRWQDCNGPRRSCCCRCRAEGSNKNVWDRYSFCLSYSVLSCFLCGSCNVAAFCVQHSLIDYVQSWLDLSIPYIPQYTAVNSKAMLLVQEGGWQACVLNLVTTLHVLKSSQLQPVHSSHGCRPSQLLPSTVLYSSPRALIYCAMVFHDTPSPILHALRLFGPRSLRFACFNFTLLGRHTTRVSCPIDYLKVCRLPAAQPSLWMVYAHTYFVCSCEQQAQPRLLGPGAHAAVWAQKM